MNQIAVVGTMMSSREIAKLCDKRHDHVMDDCRKLSDFYGKTYSPEKAGELVMASTYVDPTGRTLPCFAVTRQASLDLVTGYSLPHRHAVNKRWQELEASNAAPAPAVNLADPAFLRTVLLQYTEKVIALEQEVAAAAPKVEALERISQADGSMCITDAAKTLQTQPKELFGWLSANQWIYRRPGSAEWTAYQDKLQRGVLEHKINTVHRGDGSEKITTRVLVTSKGLATLAQKMGRAA